MLVEISKLLKFQAKKKGLQLKIESPFPERQRCKLRNNPIRIKLISLNLLGDTLKFIQKGYIIIIIEPIRYDNVVQDPNFGVPIKFSFQDTGLGIKSEGRPHLFQLFGKLKNKENKTLNQTGVGLGLAISQSLVKALNNDDPEFAI